MKCRRFVTLFAISLVALTMGAQGQSSSPPAKADTNPNETQIRQLYDGWAKAFRAHDVDAIMSIYAPANALIAYDIVPPLQYVGNAAYRKDYETFLAQYDGPIDVEYRDLRIVAGDDVAFIHTLERISGIGRGLPGLAANRRIFWRQLKSRGAVEIVFFCCSPRKQRSARVPNRRSPP